MTRSLGAIVGAILLLGAQCVAFDDPLPIDHVDVSTRSVQLLVGDSVRLTATPYGPDGRVVTGPAVGWTSTAPDVARVGVTTGWIVAVAPGRATVTASVRSRSNMATVTVVSRTPP